MYKEFKSGGEDIDKESYSGRSISVADKMLENKIYTIIQNDQKVRLFDIGYQVNVTLVLFRISLQKTEISKNLRSLDTTYANHQTSCCTP